LGEVLNSVGKPGHKDEVLATQWLIQASEFVRWKTRQYNDEHLAEVFQVIAKRPISDDFSGAAIRKKRLYLKKHYPMLYANALKRAKMSTRVDSLGSILPTGPGDGIRWNTLVAMRSSG
jgi:hypothetical protein